jgi:DNA-binding winged helix-turn-helix (wHTH) protein
MRMGLSGDRASGYEFGAFALDPERGALRGPDGEIRLRHKSFQLLLYLVRNPGRLLSREELFNAIWGNTAVTDDSLTQCLVEIRRALGDDSRQMVRTVPRRGYLFDVPVKPLGTSAALEVEPVSPAAGRLASGRLAAAGLIVVVMAAWWLFSRPGPVPAELPDAAGSRVAPIPNSIAVLPFVDMSAEQDQEHFGDGIAEEILNLLTRVEGLKVIARTSSFSFKGRQVDIGDHRRAARRRPRARGQCPHRRQPGSRHRTTRGGRRQRPPLVGGLRAGAGRHLCRADGDRDPRGRGAGGEVAQ